MIWIGKETAIPRTNIASSVSPMGLRFIRGTLGGEVVAVAFDFVDILSRLTKVRGIEPEFT
jgi:hypothetical protein